MQNLKTTTTIISLALLLASTGVLAEEGLSPLSQVLQEAQAIMHGGWQSLPRKVEALGLDDAELIELAWKFTFAVATTRGIIYLSEHEKALEDLFAKVRNFVEINDNEEWYTAHQGLCGKVDSQPTA